MNRVNLTKRILTARGWRYCPVVYSANGRVKPDLVYVDGQDDKNKERHPEGAYYIEWREDSKRVRESVGKDAADADARRERKETELKAEALGVEIVPENDGHSLKECIAEYLEDVKLKQRTNKPTNFNRHSTHGVYSKALEYFQESCSKQTLEEIDRRDLLKFAAFLREEKEQSPRSVNNKFGNVLSFLKAYNIRGLVAKQDWPRYTEQEPEIYEKEELMKLFVACDAEEHLWFEFFLMTGERDQEVRFSYWSDVNFSAFTVRVSYKPELGWSPKAYKERTIPVPAKLIKKLKARYKTANKSCPLIFPTSGCRPKKDFLDCLKAIAKRAKLDPEQFWLHKFRATYGTWSLWAGVDLRTVQDRLGHSDIESTMRYLKPKRDKHARESVNSIFE